MGSLRIERVIKKCRVVCTDRPLGLHRPPANSFGFMGELAGIIMGNRTGSKLGQLGISGFRTGFLSPDQYKPKFVGCRVGFSTPSGMYDVSRSIFIQSSRFLDYFHLLDDAAQNIPLTVIEKQFEIFALRGRVARLI